MFERKDFNYVLVVIRNVFIRLFLKYCFPRHDWFSYAKNLPNKTIMFKKF